MRGRVGGVINSTRRVFMRNQMTQYLVDYRWSVEVRGSFQETAPRKTAENTVKHRDGGVGSVLANHRNDGESSVVVSTLIFIFVCGDW